MTRQPYDMYMDFPRRGSPLAEISRGIPRAPDEPLGIWGTRKYWKAGGEGPLIPWISNLSNRKSLAASLLLFLFRILFSGLLDSPCLLPLALSSLDIRFVEHAAGLLDVKHSVYTTHVGPRLHKRRIVRVHVRISACVCACARACTRTQTHTYTGWPESGVSLGARATRSIRHVASCASTPRNVGAPLPRCSYLSSLSLFLSFSLSLRCLCSSRSYLLWPPLYNVADVFAHPRGKGRYDDGGGNGLSGRPKIRGRKYSAQQNFSTRARAARGVKKKRRGGRKLSSLARVSSTETRRRFLGGV